MKRAYIAMTLAGDGLLQAHEHPLLKGKEFVNEAAMVSMLHDHKRENKDAEMPAGIILVQLIDF